MASGRYLAPLGVFALWNAFLLFQITSCSEEFSYKDLIYSFLLCLSLSLFSILSQRRLGILIQRAALFPFAFAGGVFCVVFGYCLLTGSHISNAAIGATLQTDVAEVLDYILDNFITLYFGLFFVLGFLSSYVVLVYLADRLTIHLPGPVEWVLLVLVLASVLYLPGKFRLSIAVSKWQHEYVREIERLQVLADQIGQGGYLLAGKEGTGEIHLIVLGESACRDYMQAYGAPCPNTPWMTGMASAPGWVLFKNAYSSDVRTVPAILAALEQGNNYTGLLFPTASTIIGYSRAAGMKTFWLSNQTRYTLHGTPITALADSAEHVVFTNTGVGGVGRSPNDAILLPEVRQALASLQPEDNGLLIVHIVGSHAPYSRRIPGRDGGLIGRFFGRATETFDPAWSDYEISLLLTDRLLGEIHALLAATGRPATMVYMSDHGEDLQLGHNEDMFTWPMARIPFSVWLSPEYMARYPGKIEALRNNRERVLTNDLLFDLYIGLAGILSEGLQDGLDPGSPAYSLDWRSAVTLSGKQPVAEDPLAPAP